MRDLPLLVNLLQLAVKDRTQLTLENIALRHQLAVYKRSVKRPNINDGEPSQVRPGLKRSLVTPHLGFHRVDMGIQGPTSVLDESFQGLADVFQRLRAAGVFQLTAQPGVVQDPLESATELLGISLKTVMRGCLAGI